MADKATITLKDAKAGEKTFQLQTGPMPDFLLMEFFAKSGDPDAQIDAALMLDLLEASIAEDSEKPQPGEWSAFRRWARKIRNFHETDHAIDILKARMETAAEDFPSSQPSDSSDGQPVTEPKSETGSDAQVVEMSDFRVDLWKMQQDAIAAKNARTA